MTTIQTQKNEFDAVDELSRAYKNLPPVVDDGYPEMRHYYESALNMLIVALRDNRPELFTIKKTAHATINIIALHQRMTAHLFPAFSSTDERFLALALCGEAGELANLIKKRWRDGADLQAECRDEIADIRIYLELLATCFNVEGIKLDAYVQNKVARVVKRLAQQEPAP